MTQDEVVDLQLAMAVYDLRELGAVDSAFWYRQMKNIDYADAEEAVHRYYADHTERMMPAHVREGVAAIRRDRRYRTQPGLDMDTARRYADDPAGYIRALRAREHEIASGPQARQALEAGQ